MRFRVAIILSSAVALSGCATILNKPTQQVNVSTSNGQQVKGTVNGAAFAAPGVVQVKRENKNKTFTTEDGNCTKETVAAKQVDSVFFINILSGGLLGSSTDFGSEKMWKYNDNVVINCKG
ncbi:adenosine deaminase [Novosphingobium umbonatum]|uniref:Adenosine deaminase n=1 Tax=Novosphingobium umbonatum TaxID=1908524 RepID=A0A3S2V9P3_9SPHN|nr:adenosine deaminase [Novosphingobium umbonatum]RVU07144.1 adenosine deaminase [Novosphingobium umbonatum]